MAPRANWKGFLRLSLVTCPVALYPATSDSEKISFNQINRNTGHRIKYTRVDADTGEEVASEDIMKGFKVDTDTYVEVTKEELENIALESTRTIEIDEFVQQDEIDPRYIIRPYYAARCLAELGNLTRLDIYRLSDAWRCQVTCECNPKNLRPE
jgi:DNA end-binding protein Ku